MKNLDPYLRYIAVSSYLPNKVFVKAYDCRFFFVLSGEGELRTDSVSYPLKENTLAYYPSGVPYILSSSTESPLLFISVNFDFTSSYPEASKTLRPIKLSDFSVALERPTQREISDEHFLSTFTIDHAFFLREDLLSLASQFGKNEVYNKEMCSTFLKYIILKISNHFGKEGKENTAVNKVIAYIDEHYSERLDNKAVAAKFGYHAYYLSSLFKKHTGKTLHQYITEARLRFGCDMLINTDAPISEIATRCGFQNVNHFSVKFKKQYNESPSRWRRIN